MPAMDDDIGARLRAEREARRWSREELARRMRAASPDAIPATASLAHMIKEWEVGKHQPGPRNRGLLAAALGMDEAVLLGVAGRPEPDWTPGSEQDADRLAFAVTRPGRIDGGTVEALATVLAGQRRLEDVTGSVPVLHAVRAQLPVVHRLTIEARGPVRSDLVNVAAQWSQFAGWLYAAGGDYDSSQRSLDVAAAHAEEVGDRDMIGTVLSWRGYVARQRRQIGPMIGLSQAARRDRRGPGMVYDYYQEAIGHAMAGDVPAAERVLGDAQQAAQDADAGDARPWEYYYTEPGFWDLVTGLVHLSLGEHDGRHNAAAIDVFTAGLSALPPEMRHADWAGNYDWRLAMAYVQAGDVDAALAALLEAAGIARATPAAALLRRVRRLHARMRSRWPDHTGVAELADVLR